MLALHYIVLYIQAKASGKTSEDCQEQGNAIGVRLLWILYIYMFISF